MRYNIAMGAWYSLHWFDLIQTTGIIGGLLFTARMAERDQKARIVANLLAVNEQYGRIWRECYERPELDRILRKQVDLEERPVTSAETLFIKTLILHLDAVRRIMEAGIFIEIQGLQSDIREFFALPIPKAVRIASG